MIKIFEKIVGTNNIQTQDLKPYNVDWMNKYHGQSQIVLTPQSVEQISEILKYCNQENIKIVPQSGNTGLVGGGVPVNNEVILQMRKLNKIIDFDENTSIVTSESGVILDNLNSYLQKFNFKMAWDLGARGSCMLGGNISTNAGGLNVVKYGLLRNYIMGLEVVLPNGKVLNLMNKNRKDNTGTDLKQLFIGSEGTLGVITKANVLCIPVPKQQKVFFMELNSFNEVIKALEKVKKNEQLHAFEFMEGRILKKQSNSPFDFSDQKYYVLIEIAGQQIDVDKFCTTLLEFTDKIVMDQNEKEALQLWKLRESIAESMGKMGYVLKYDVSIPPDKFEWLVNQIYPQRIGPFHVFYGHVGDGNVHINIVLNSLEELHTEETRIELKLFQLVKQLNGSISAEHGIGQHKRKYMELQKGRDVLEYLQMMKQQIVGVQNLITDPFDLKPLNQDWQRFYTGKSELAITPTSTKMISEVLQFCNQNNIKVVPQGGNTSFVGGATPVQDEVILSLKKMNNILEFDATTSIVTAESGIILEQLNDHLQAYGYQMPWDLGARGSCQLGGNISTNAGGLNVVRNGPLRNYIMGLEVVLPNGKILNLLNKNRKDNTGTDLKQLFIGSEGTLGVITKANVLCNPIPPQRQVFFLELKNFDEVIYLLRSAKQFEQLSAFEFMEGRILERCVSLNSQLKAPFNFHHDNYYVLIEISGQQIDLDYYCEKLLKHTEQIVFNQNDTELQAMWRWRESVPENLHKMGHVLTYDLSIPPDRFEWFAEQVYFGRKGPYNAFYGHLGDGNIHYNIIFDSETDMHNEQHKVEEKIINLTKNLNGSISAEHGIGQLKRHYMKTQKGEETYSYMQELKRMFDPNNILNPNKLL